MKTKEFIEKVTEMGYGIERCGLVLIISSRDNNIARVSTVDALGIDTEGYTEHLDEQLFDLIVEYAKTPFEDRTERYFNIKLTPSELNLIIYNVKIQNSSIVAKTNPVYQSAIKKLVDATEVDE